MSLGGAGEERLLFVTIVEAVGVARAFQNPDIIS